MKTPIDVVTGTIVDIDEHGIVTIKAKYDDWLTLVRRQYKQCNIQMIDSRPLSQKQRNACYAMIRAVSEYSGEGLDQTKEWLKLKFLAEDLQETAEQIFSLSNGPMSLVCAFQRYLVRFMLDWEIPCNYPLIKYVDDIQDYEYACLQAKKCCVCGQPSDLHHVDHVGAGRDREEIIHEGMRVLPLCRIHHNEAHLKGEIQFRELYHLDNGVILDKDLCKLYRLKRKEENENA